jgi:hypothetical protein
VQLYLPRDIPGTQPDRIGPEVKTRDSILLTYFVDAGALRYFRNRGKRVGNFLLSELRNRLPQPSARVH